MTEKHINSLSKKSMGEVALKSELYGAYKEEFDQAVLRKNAGFTAFVCITKQI
jgi:hypothetical protein